MSEVPKGKAEMPEAVRERRKIALREGIGLASLTVVCPMV